MITFTREQLIEHAQKHIAHDAWLKENFPDAHKTPATVDLARIALAAMQQEPVPPGELTNTHSSVIAEQLAHVLSGMTVSEHQRAIISCAVDRLNENAEILQHHPSPDEGRADFEKWMLKKWGRERQEYYFAMGKFLHGEDYADSYTRRMWNAWTASRAALLQVSYFRENSNSSTDTFREIPETSTNCLRCGGRGTYYCPRMLGTVECECTLPATSKVGGS